LAATNSRREFIHYKNAGQGNLTGFFEGHSSFAASHASRRKFWLGISGGRRKRLRTSNACENINGQIKKRTRVVGRFPSEESLLRLVSGVHIEISEAWETDKIYHLQKKVCAAFQSIREFDER
jgi:transposase-like protein